MIRKKKLYQRPRQIFEKERINEENKLVETYALKNKKEIWKTLAKVNYYRGRAKALAKKPLEEQEVLLNKLKALGLNTNTTTEVLGLKVEDILRRRLPTIITKRKLAHTVKQARQMVVHKKVLIDGKAVSVPSYLVPLSEESQITIKKKERKPKAKKENVEPEITEETKTEKQKGEIAKEEQKSEEPKPEETKEEVKEEQ